MRKTPLIAILLSTLSLGLSLSSCSNESSYIDQAFKHKASPEQGLSELVSGTIIDKTGLAGCKYMIELSDGTLLEPINLDAELKEAGTIVDFRFRRARGYMSICMAGPLVELFDVKRINSEDSAELTDDATSKE
jgi:hypothetical protein